MRQFTILISLGLTACGGGLSPQQREEVRAIAKEEAKRSLDAEIAAQTRLSRRLLDQNADVDPPIEGTMNDIEAIDRSMGLPSSQP